MVKKSGFSLIELIVVIGLLSLLMLAISSTMLMSIVSSNRIRTATATKQAGNYALGQIQGMIRNAKEITLCDSSTSSITLINPDGGETQFYLNSARIASGSANFLTPEDIEIVSFSISCLPSDTTPSLVKVAYDLKNQLATARATSNPTLHFETSISLRNE